MTHLRSFIKSDQAPRRTHQEWAELIGISRTYFTEIVSGSKSPGRRVIGIINDVTGGRVPPAVWFEDRRTE